MRKIFLLATLCLWCGCLFGANKVVDDQELIRDLKSCDRLLNVIEIGFWNAAAVEHGRETYNDMAAKINELCALTRKIQTRVRGQNKKNLVEPALKLRSVFSNLTPGHLSKRRISVSKTSVSAFRSEYMRVQRRLRNDEIKRGKKFARGEREIPDPTIFNIDIAQYEEWLSDRAVSDSSSVRVGKGGKNETLKRYVDDYVTAMTRLRVGIAEIAQDELKKQEK